MQADVRTALKTLPYTRGTGPLTRITKVGTGLHLRLLIGEVRFHGTRFCFRVTIDEAILWKGAYGFRGMRSSALWCWKG